MLLSIEENKLLKIVFMVFIITSAIFVCVFIKSPPKILKIYFITILMCYKIQLKG